MLSFYKVTSERDTENIEKFLINKKYYKIDQRSIHFDALYINIDV